MPKVDVLNQEGKVVGNTLLPKEVFEVKLNSDLVHQVAVSQMANRRQNIAHTKGRGDVSGGGRKPWRQKHTGRARHGSIRSPIWRGGGITFGPTKERKFSKKLPQKMKRKALLMVLSAKAKNNLIILLDKLEIEKIKTKQVSGILKNLKCQDKTCLIALPSLNKKIILSARNLPKAETTEARNLNCLDLLSFQYLIMPKEAVKIIKENFVK